MKKITEDWLKSAYSDLEICRQILNQENLSPQVAFHAQQTVEKSFKAIMEEYDLGFVKTHTLNTLLGKIESKIQFKVDSDMLLLLDQLYIDSRYPGELGLLPDGYPSLEQTKNFYDFASNIFKTVSLFLK
jgi:HEPN domain-containing protein